MNNKNYFKIIFNIYISFSYFKINLKNLIKILIFLFKNFIILKKIFNYKKLKIKNINNIYLFD